MGGRWAGCPQGIPSCGRSASGVVPSAAWVTCVPLWADPCRLLAPGCVSHRITFGRSPRRACSIAVELCLILYNFSLICSAGSLSSSAFYALATLLYIPPVWQALGVSATTLTSLSITSKDAAQLDLHAFASSNYLHAPGALRASGHCTPSALAKAFAESEFSSRCGRGHDTGTWRWIALLEPVRNKFVRVTAG